MQIKLKKALIWAFSAIFFICLWYFAGFLVNSTLILPLPHQVFGKLLSLLFTKSFYAAMGACFGRCVCAFLFSACLSFVLGFLMGLSPGADIFFKFPLALIKATPAVTFVLLALFWFNSGNVPVFVAFLMTLPILTQAAAAGVGQCDEKLKQMCRVFGFSPVQKCLYLYFPSIWGQFAPALISSFELTWKVVLAGEILSLPKNSVGAALYSAKVHLESAEVFAWTFAVVIFSQLCKFLIIWAVKQSKNLGEKLEKRKNCPKTAQIENNDDFLSYFENIKSALNPDQAAPDINVENLCLGFGKRQIFDNFNISFARGKVTAILAPSGAGKTTLLNSIAGILPYKSGRIAFINEESAHSSPKKSGSNLSFGRSFCKNSQNPVKNTAASHFSYIFQDFRFLPWLSIEKNCQIAAKAQKNNLQNKQKSANCAGLLNFFNINAQKMSKPANLSGGEKQRSAFARGLAVFAPVLLLDEAFNAQDLAAKKRLYKVFCAYQKVFAPTTILVTHSAAEALALADRIVVLKGSLAQNGGVQIVLDKNTGSLKEEEISAALS